MFRKSSDGTHYRQSFFARNFRTSREAAERMKHGRIERPRKAALLRRDGLIHSPVPRCDGAGRRGLLDAAAEKYGGQGRGERLLTGRASRAGRDAADAGGGAAAGGGKAGRTGGGAARGVRLHSCGRRHRRCAPDDPLEVAPAARGRSVEGGRACMALGPEAPQG